MKKQSTKYFLGLALFAVWGLVGYRLYTKLYKSNQAYLLPPPIEISDAPATDDSFTLSLDYRDPFLDKKLSRPKAVQVKQVAKKVNVPPKPKAKTPIKTVEFPDMQYKGNIALKDGRQVALVSINGEIVNLGLGESYEQVALMEIEQDSIQIGYRGEVMMVAKFSGE
ncbi:MAG: hypothetical protein AAFP19_04205 [Bacteroidota bacterium]